MCIRDRSFTLLPDGRVVEIGGEHEDFYDPDFCIYNEVVVYDGKGGFEIFGYPEAIFPPTDFHTATYLEGKIYIVGCLGYSEDRRVGETPVYVLDCQDYSIQKMKTSGSAPGWISRHVSRLDQSAKKLEIRDGKLESKDGYQDNQGCWSLDLTSGHWQVVSK